MRTVKFLCLCVTSVLGALLFSTLASAAAPNESSMSQASMPAILRLAAVAYEDFAKRIKANRRGDSEIEVLASNIDNYRVTVSLEEGGTCVVDFDPKPPKGGGTWRGGNSRYSVDAKTGKILKYTAYR